MKKYGAMCIGIVFSWSVYAAVPVTVWKFLGERERHKLVAETLPGVSVDVIKGVVQEYDKNLDATTTQQIKECKPLIYGDTTAVGFSLINESSQVIWVGVINDKIVMTKNRQVDPKANVSRFIDINKPTRVIIWTKNPGEALYESLSPLQVTPAPQFQFDVAMAKTIYLKWDGANMVIDAGKPGCKMSTLGLALDTNVQSSDVKKVEYKQPVADVKPQPTIAVVKPQLKVRL